MDWKRSKVPPQLVTTPGMPVRQGRRPASPGCAKSRTPPAGRPGGHSDLERTGGDSIPSYEKVAAPDTATERSSLTNP